MSEYQELIEAAQRVLKAANEDESEVSFAFAMAIIGLKTALEGLGEAVAS